MKRLNTLVIGSGAAGLAAAVRLNALGVESLAIYTEGPPSTPEATNRLTTNSACTDSNRIPLPFLPKI